MKQKTSLSKDGTPVVKGAILSKRLEEALLRCLEDDEERTVSQVGRIFIREAYVDKDFLYGNDFDAMLRDASGPGGSYCFTMVPDALAMLNEMVAAVPGANISQVLRAIVHRGLRVRGYLK